jgi:hypothetical protein
MLKVNRVQKDEKGVSDTGKIIEKKIVNFKIAI